MIRVKGLNIQQSMCRKSETLFYLLVWSCPPTHCSLHLRRLIKAPFSSGMCGCLWERLTALQKRPIHPQQLKIAARVFLCGTWNFLTCRTQPGFSPLTGPTSASRWLCTSPWRRETAPEVWRWQKREGEGYQLARKLHQRKSDRKTSGQESRECVNFLFLPTTKASWCKKSTYKIVSLKSFHRGQRFLQLLVRALQTVDWEENKEKLRTRAELCFKPFINMTGWASSKRRRETPNLAQETQYD